MRKKIIFEELTESEKEVFNDAFNQFETGATYASLDNNTGLRDKLQKDYVEHRIECFRKYRKNRSRF